MNTLEHVLSVHNVLGEGALWDADEQAFYWVDILKNCYHRFYPASGSHDVINVGVPLGVLALRASGGLVLAVKDGFAFWDEEKQALDYIAQPFPDQLDIRFNDGAVDSGGRFWAGSMGPEGPGVEPVGILYRLDPDASLHIMETHVGVSNGIGWSPDNRTMYYTDSPLKTIYAYDYDAATGNIANRRVFVHDPEIPGDPDGLTVDSEGYIWSARWDGARIMRYDPDGKAERVIEVPVLRPTSCVFGGENLNDLYITSASVGLSTGQLARYPQSGDLFRLQTDIKGLQKYRFAG